MADLCEAVGKKLAAALVSTNPHAAEDLRSMGIRVREHMIGTYREDVTTANSSGSYTTLLAKTLYTAAEDRINEVIKILPENRDLIEAGGGAGAYKVPIVEPSVAYDVAEGETVSYADSPITSKTFTPTKKIFGTRITWEIQKRAAPFVLQYILNNAARAVARKLASDILNGLAVNVNTADNVVNGGVSYDNLVDAESKIEGAISETTDQPYGFEPDTLVLTPTAYATLKKSADWKEHVYRATVVPKGEGVTVARPVEYFGKMKIVISPYLTASVGGNSVQALLVDSTSVGFLLKESDLEVKSGRINQSADDEVIGVMSYATCVLYDKAMSVVTV